MDVLDWIVDFVSPVVREETGQPRVLAVQLCPVTYGYWYVDDCEASSRSDLVAG